MPNLTSRPPGPKACLKESTFSMFSGSSRDRLLLALFAISPSLSSRTLPHPLRDHSLALVAIASSLSCECSLDHSLLRALFSTALSLSLSLSLSPSLPLSLSPSPSLSPSLPLSFSLSLSLSIFLSISLFLYLTSVKQEQQPEKKTPASNLDMVQVTKKKKKKKNEEFSQTN